MRRFLGKLSLILILLAVIVILPNVIIDPYNVFHADAVVDNGVEMNKNYIKTRYVLAHQEDYDSYVFGSSRAGFYDVTLLPDGDWYNMAYSEGLPAEHYETLLTFIEAGEIPKQVWLCLDNVSFLVDPALHESQLYRMAYPYSGSLLDKISFYTSYFDLITTIQSLSVINSYQDGDTAALRQRLYTTGCEDLTADIQFYGDKDTASWDSYYWNRAEEALEEIKQFVELCQAYDIELTVVINPVYIATYERSVNRGYISFLEGLAEITPYYNFSGYNKITQDTYYYYEHSHFNPEAGAMVIDAVVNGTATEEERLGTGFGYYVTSDNVDDFILLLRHQVDVTGVLPYTEAY